MQRRRGYRIAIGVALVVGVVALSAAGRRGRLLPAIR